MIVRQLEITLVFIYGKLIMQRKKIFTFSFLFCFLITGCTHQTTEEDRQVASFYIEQPTDFKLEPLKTLDNLPSPQEDESYFVHMGNRQAYVQKLKKDLASRFTDDTLSIQLYDFDTDTLTDINGLTDKKIFTMTYYQDALIYSRVSTNNIARLVTLDVIELKDGVSRVLATAQVDNYPEFTPFFEVSNQKLYFMLSNVEVDTSQDNKATLYQKLYVYDGSSLNVEFESSCPYDKGYSLSPNIPSGSSMMYTHRFYRQANGSLLFQEFTKEGSTLHYLQDDKWMTYPFNDDPTNTIEIHGQNRVISYLEHYVFYVNYQPEKGEFYLLNLETGEKNIVEYASHHSLLLFYNINNTAMFFTEEPDFSRWVVALQKDESLKIERIDDVILEKLGIQNDHYTSIRYATNDAYILIEVQEFDDEYCPLSPVPNYYKLTFEHTQGL